MIITTCGNCGVKIRRNAPVGKDDIPVCSLDCGRVILDTKKKGGA